MIGRLEHGKILFSREYNEYNKDYSFSFAMHCLRSHEQSEAFLW